MLTSILAAALFVAFSAGFSYWLSNKFWNTEYSRTNTSGDFGSPRGGFFSILGGAVLSMFLLVYVGKYVIDPAVMTYALIGVMVCGAIGGMIPLFRNRKK